MKKTTWATTAEVLDVVDGDTFRARLDLGWRISIVVLVRVRGVNAPELPSATGEAAGCFWRRCFRLEQSSASSRGGWTSTGAAKRMSVCQRALTLPKNSWRPVTSSPSDVELLPQTAIVFR